MEPGIPISKEQHASPQRNPFAFARLPRWVAQVTVSSNTLAIQHPRLQRQLAVVKACGGQNLLYRHGTDVVALRIK